MRASAFVFACVCVGDLVVVVAGARCHGRPFPRTACLSCAAVAAHPETRARTCALDRRPYVAVFQVVSLCVRGSKMCACVTMSQVCLCVPLYPPTHHLRALVLVVRRFR